MEDDIGEDMNQVLKEAFNKEAQIYDETTSYLLFDYNQMLTNIIEAIEFKSSDVFSILDVGCGTGNLLSLLRKRFPNAVIYGLDFSTDMLEIAQSKHIERINYVNADLFNIKESTLPFFDVIISSYVFHNFHIIDEHKDAMAVLNQMLSVDGMLIIGDLIDPGNAFNRKKKNKKLIAQMQSHNIPERDILKWLCTLELEDSPLTVQNNIDILSAVGYEDIHAHVFNNSYSAIFTGRKQAESIQIKQELLYYGVQPNTCSKELFVQQNPNNITKTGNTGIFLTIDGLDVLVGFKNSINNVSPYEFVKHGEDFSLLKFGRDIPISVNVIKMPDWVFKDITVNNKPEVFSNYFLYEGHGFIHLAYKACSFNTDEKCKFCSVERRDYRCDNTAESICEALDQVLDFIPEDIEICLGGGTYKPFSENVKYFKKIASFIRGKGKTNPIWIEMIPPSIPEIQELIEAGATSFGFNIEIWDDQTRSRICPGKSAVSKEHYIESCKYVAQTLGVDSIGSCLIVGLDNKQSISEAIDILLELGIQPCILQYKDYDTNLGDYCIPSSMQRDFYELSRETAEKAMQRGMFFVNSQGCLKCNCCTIMHDMQKTLIH